MSHLNGSVNVPPAVVAIPADLRRRMDLYISECKYEISGLGTVELNDFGELEVADIYLLDQEVSSGDTTLNVDSVAQFMVEAPDKGIDLSKVRLWWHSHAAIATYWSSTDEATISSFNQAPWFVSIVGNHAGDYLARLDLFPQESVPVRLAQPAVLTTVHPQKEVERARSEIAEHVSKAPTSSYGIVKSSSSTKKSKGKAKSKGRKAGTKTEPRK